MSAYGFTTSGVDTGFAEVIVRRLDDGRQLRVAPATMKPLAPESFQSVDSVVVKLDGAVAWTAHASSIIRRGTDIEVERADARGHALLDSGSGPGIDVHSLRLHGSTLSWRHRTVTRSASLR